MMPLLTELQFFKPLVLQIFRPSRGWGSRISIGAGTSRQTRTSPPLLLLHDGAVPCSQFSTWLLPISEPALPSALRRACWLGAEFSLMMKPKRIPTAFFLLLALPLFSVSSRPGALGAAEANLA